MPTFFSKRRVLLAFAGGICLVVVLISLRLEFHDAQAGIDVKPPGGYRIVRTADGFSPERITIPLGETVTFSSEGDPFWPASNLHPSHDIYPEFDPGRTLASEESWAFTFTRSGMWRFHDHVAANAGGVITVIDPSGFAPRQPTDLRECENLALPEKQGCWDNLLSHVLRADGFDAAFKLFIRLYETEPDVPKGCHGWGHVLGKTAYDLYAAGERFDLPDEVSYCGYGFYHGFLEGLVGETGDAGEAYQFCRSLRADTPKEKAAYQNCIHGIGHGGAAAIIEQPVMWGKYEAAIARGADLCRSFTNDPDELRECFDGVFNEMVLSMWNGQYGLSAAQNFDSDDPLGLCHAQPKELQTSCYFEYMGVFEHVFAGDLERASAFVFRDISDPADAAVAIRKLAADFMQSAIVRDSYAPEIRACMSLPTSLESECFNGIEIGLVAHGEPDREYMKALTFCDSNLLPPEHANRCFSWMIDYFKGRYDEDLFDAVCRFLPGGRRMGACAL